MKVKYDKEADVVYIQLMMSWYRKAMKAAKGSFWIMMLREKLSALKYWRHLKNDDPGQGRNGIA